MAIKPNIDPFEEKKKASSAVVNTPGVKPPSTIEKINPTLPPQLPEKFPATILPPLRDETAPGGETAAGKEAAGVAGTARFIEYRSLARRYGAHRLFKQKEEQSGFVLRSCRAAAGGAAAVCRPGSRRGGAAAL